MTATNPNWPAPSAPQALVKADYHRSATTTTEWLTPKSLIDALGPFDLDPCVPTNGMPWATATMMLSPREDGLVTPWHPDMFVWNNPPYGRDQAQWMRKAAEHGNGITLVLNRTETQWFQDDVFNHENVTALLFVRSRIRFCDLNGKKAGTTTAGSVLVAYGEKALDRLRAAKDAGKVLGTLFVVRRSSADQRAEDNSSEYLEVA